MIAVRILKQKSFMAKLLTTELFDSFLIEEASVDTFNTFTIDGRIHRDFYNGLEDETEIPKEEFSHWSKIRPICLELIKGKQTPLGFKFVLRMNDEEKTAFLSGVDTDLSPEYISLGLVVKFSKGQVIITSAVAYSIFTLDKSAEKAWDAYIPSFLDSKDIENEIM